jgi:hypothetical protein
MLGETGRQVMGPIRGSGDFLAYGSPSISAKGGGGSSGRSVLLLSRTAGGQGHTAQLGSYDTLLEADKKKVMINGIEQEYLAYLFLNNSNVKMHSQLKKDVANDYSKGNTDTYPDDIHKALTLMNKYKPLKLDTPAVPAQGTVFVTKDQGGKNKGKEKT